MSVMLADPPAPRLSDLRRRLQTLCAQRQRVRWATGLAGWAAALCAILLAAYLWDWLTEWSPGPRVALLAAMAAAALAGFRKLALPWLGRREGELDVALLVERNEQIDSDLVAALQFETEVARSWGSGQLQTAVIEYVAQFGRSWRFDDISDRRPLKTRLAWAGLGLAIVVGCAALWPAHALTFARRLLLAPDHYPTRTQLVTIRVSGQTVYEQEADGPRAPRAARAAQGEALRVEVVVAGELPAEGRLELTSQSAGLSAVAPLVQRSAPGAAGQASYHGELPRLTDSVRYQLYLGDAWTDPAVVEVIPLPIVTVVLEPTPPAYARSLEPPPPQAGARQIQVLEGSRVELEVQSSNKPLESVVLRLDGRDEPLSLSPADESRKSWRLDVADTPLAEVHEAVSFSVQVTDVDGLQLPAPLQGFVRLKNDRPPRVSAAVVTRYVLPTAEPTIALGAVDDFGLSQLRVHRKVLRAGETHELEPLVVPLSDDHPKSLQTSLPVDLTSFDLAKGDEVEITLEALDYRGELAGKSNTSEPLILYVTDERGVLEAMRETDERSAEQLDAIIQRELGIGGSP